MNNKGMIVLCIVAIVALVGWLAALAGRETIEDLTNEIKFLKGENARLERKEPSTVEAVAALVAKCERRTTCEECGYKDRTMNIFCNRGKNHLPEGFPAEMAECDKTIGNEVEAKAKEYMEANK